jgi:hypothetical protein
MEKENSNPEISPILEKQSGILQNAFIGRRTEFQAFRIFPFPFHAASLAGWKSNRFIPVSCVLQA